MLRIDRLCIYVIIFGLISLIPSIDRIKFLDELSVMALGCIAFIDCIFNNAWRKYSALWIVMAILAFYAIYSIAYVNNNVPEAILTDWVIEQKPYIPLLVLLGIGPKLNHVDRRNINLLDKRSNMCYSTSWRVNIDKTNSFSYHIWGEYYFY